MPFEFKLPDISQNQLLQAGLSAFAGSMPGSNTNPYLAAVGGFQQGTQQDHANTQAKREEEAFAMQKAAFDQQQAQNAAWNAQWGGAAPGQPNTQYAQAGGGDMADIARTPGIAPNTAGTPLDGPATGNMGLLANFQNSPQAASLLQSMGPQAGGKFLLEQMFKKPAQRRIVDGADGYKYFSDTGERVLPNVEARDPKLLSPAALQQQTQIAQAGQPTSQTTVDLKGETEESKEVGKWQGQQYTSIQDAATQARSNNARLDRLGQLLDQAYTGTGAEAVLELGRIGQKLGFEVGDGVAPAEAAQALSSQMALELRNPAGGAGMPGAMSDRDREFLQSMVPGLGQTKEGRGMMIETQKRLNQRSIEVAKRARQYRKQNGRLDEGFYDELDQWSAENPLFADLAPPEQSGPPDVGADYQVPEPAQRTVGGFYQTPKGYMQWTGEGWVTAQ